MKISKVIGYQVLDSRGRPTVAASISLTDGTTHTARVPSGASTGVHEAK
jgi:enolase